MILHGVSFSLSFHANCRILCVLPVPVVVTVYKELCVVVPEHGGAPFRQIFLSWNGAAVNIVYHSRQISLYYY